MSKHPPNAKYSIDISYFLQNESTLKTTPVQIVSKYPDCTWYATDLGPGGRCNEDGTEIRKYISYAYMMSSLDTLKSIIKDVGAVKDLWIPFCTIAYDQTFYHIYYADSVLACIIPESVEKYNAIRAQYTGDDKDVYDLCVCSAK